MSHFRIFSENSFGSAGEAKPARGGVWRILKYERKKLKMHFFLDVSFF